jgi:hypothetical protein
MMARKTVGLRTACRTIWHAVADGQIPAGATDRYRQKS